MNIGWLHAFVRTLADHSPSWGRPRWRFPVRVVHGTIDTSPVIRSLRCPSTTSSARTCNFARNLNRAFASKAWKPRRQGHIRRLSRALGQVEEELQQANVIDDLFVALVSGISGLEQVPVAC